MKERICARLSALGQTHISDYLEQLNDTAQETMLRQIDTLDLSILDPECADEKRGSFAPLYATTLGEIAQNRARFTETGLAAIRAGKVGAVLLGGGQGTRLGCEHAKGMVDIGITRELFIFECLMNNLKRVTDQAGAYVPLFIMTSAENHDETQAFFAEKNYFGYSREHIRFFRQEQLPTVDPEGRLMLSAPGVISTAPNGNGGWYASMENTGMLSELRRSRIEWLNVFAVDNVLQAIADPCFIGAVIESGNVSGAKVVAKAAPDEKVGVLCLEDGRPSIVEYYEMTEEMRTRREPDGTLSYRFGVILNYLFRVDELENTLAYNMPLHKVFKKIRYMDENGNTVRPEAPNAYKFETLALDLVKLQKNCLAYEIEREKEFAPIKNQTGVDSVETARELLRRNGSAL
ncbi:MAG: UTP--glucose-1-phosphate uridylyltransferase [Oscillospiraceae bacterium]|nr:UTP--glucose-1-phosphate uridylyltransferase [Oscillospiraceae bacterium]